YTDTSDENLWRAVELASTERGAKYEAGI
ncbi:MAG: hypothetical protein AWT59_3342, partial [Candidatus Gallionella acididurans]